MLPTKDIITLSVTILLAVGGWLIGHWLTARREIEQKKREIRVVHLREAYLKLANLADRGSLPEDIHDVQDAFNDIQIFGEERQIGLMATFIQELNEGKSPQINELLKELRNEIRQHIGLKSIDDYRWHIRIDKNQAKA